MSQELARHLLSAGSNTDSAGTFVYILSVDPTKSFLNCQHWKGDSITKQELLVESVRPESTAAYLITPSEKLVVCITPSSKLVVYTYDPEDREWVECDDTILSNYTIYPNGKLVGSLDGAGRAHIIFQDSSQRLISSTFFNDEWISTTLPLPAVGGTPISTLASNVGLLVYYISVADNLLHVAIQQQDGRWKDAVAGKHKFTEEIKSFCIGKEEIFVLTAKNALLKITIEDVQTSLGTVRNGKFVPETVEEAGYSFVWYPYGCGSAEFPGYTGLGGTGFGHPRF